MPTGGGSLVGTGSVGGYVADSLSILKCDGDLGQIVVERGIAELRAGRPVLVKAGRTLALVMGIDSLDENYVPVLEELSRHRARLLLPAARLRRLGRERTQPGAIALPTIDLARIASLSLDANARLDATVAAVSKLDLAALELARISLILPALVVVPVSARAVADQALVRVDAVDINAYRAAGVRDLRITGRAPVPLDGAQDTEFVVFRGGEGMRDQVAVVIGKPNYAEPVTVRLHSACLTGDLFGSLKCDCGDQLRHTARYMAENDGGILLYLDQEGRGNGLSNKIRAYKLQAQGFDTYDADEVLGFDHDQRGFDFAAEMLKQLGVTQVRVMTNNPIKMAALERAGLVVVSDHRIQGRKTDENVRYLATKRDRAGHFLDADDAPVKGGAQD